MKFFKVRLPLSLHRQLRELAKSEGISINQLATSALAEKMSALMTETSLAERAERGSREKFLDALAKVLDAEPDPEDTLLAE